MCTHSPVDWLGIATFLVIFAVAVQYLWDKLLLGALPRTNATLRIAATLRYIIALILIISVVFAGMSIWKEVTG